MKLTICCLCIYNAHPDMIVLDEPANNLDIKSLKVLIHAFKAYNGTLLMVSHDPTFTKALEVKEYIDL